MIVKKLFPSPATSFDVSRLLYEKHIYNAVDHRMHDVWYAHEFLKDIESGKNIVFGVFSKDENRFLGCVVGEIYCAAFIAHLLFKRKVDVVKAALLVEQEVKKLTDETGENVKTVKGYIPECNRAALRMAKKAGYKDKGISSHVSSFRDGAFVVCRYVVKEI